MACVCTAAPSKPGPPSLSVDPSGSVTVSWEASAAEASDAPVLGYRIVSRPAGAQEDAFTVLASVGKGATRATLDSLARGVGYEIKVSKSIHIFRARYLRG